MERNECHYWSIKVWRFYIWIFIIKTRSWKTLFYLFWINMLCSTLHNTSKILSSNTIYYSPLMKWKILPPLSFHTCDHTEIWQVSQETSWEGDAATTHTINLTLTQHWASLGDVHPPFSHFQWTVLTSGRWPLSRAHRHSLKHCADTVLVQCSASVVNCVDGWPALQGLFYCRQQDG